MALTRQFECESCGALGKVVLRGDEHNSSDVVFCPCCGGDIYEDDEEDFDDEE